MMVTLNIDTDEQNDRELLKKIVTAIYPETGKPVVKCGSIMEVAKRRLNGENAVFAEDGPQPRKRGRKPRIAEDKNA